MEWISGVGRNESGQLCIEVQGQAGARAWTQLKSMRPDLGYNRTVRRRTTLDLPTLQPVDPSEYLRGLTLQALDASAQRVFQIDTTEGTMLIPSQLLVLALVGSKVQLRHVLLRPWGPTCLMCAVVHSERLDVAPTPNSRLKLQLNKPGLQSRMAWVLSYPSATAAWCSVYSNALDGRFDMRIPAAVVGASLRGKKVGGKLLVTQLQVLELTPTEGPHEFAAACAPRHFVFNNLVNVRTLHGKGSAPTGDSRISTGGSVVPLTDDQWARIEPVLFANSGKSGSLREGRVRKLRDLVEVIRLKLGTPYAWAKCPGERALVRSATVLHSTLQRSGVWEKVVAAQCDS